MSDIILNDDDTIQFVGTIVGPLEVRGAGEITSTGSGGGFSFTDRNPQVSQRWVWYAQDSKARLYADGAGDRLAVLPNGRVGVGTLTPERSLHVEGSEVHSGGVSAGFSFASRGSASFVDNPTNGERWVWYAANGSARLWSGTDRFILGKTSAQLNGDLLVTKILTCPVVKGVDAGTQLGADPQVRIWARDFILEHVTVDPTTGTVATQVPGDNGGNIALSHLPGDKLVVNRGDGYTGGVAIEGKQGLTVEGPLNVSHSLSFQTSGISVTDADILIKNVPKSSDQKPSQVRLSSDNVVIAPQFIHGLPSTGTWTELNLNSSGFALETKSASFPVGQITTVGKISISSEGIRIAPIDVAGLAQTWRELNISSETIVIDSYAMVNGTVGKTSVDLVQEIEQLKAQVHALEAKVQKLTNP